MSHHHVTLDRVRYGYPDHDEILHGIDLDVPPTSRLALLGANGSGKPTLLRCLSGALRPRSGTVLIDGTPVAYNRARLLRHRQTVQLVVQDPDDQLFSASARAGISFGPTNLGLAETELLEHLDTAPSIR